MVTTVKIHEKTKTKLDQLRKGNETYDEIILRLTSEVKKRLLVQELTECYQSEEKSTLNTLEEWEAASKEVD